MPSRLKASDGRRIAPRKSACSREVFAGGGVELVQRETAGDQGQDAAGLQGVDALGDEEIMQRQLFGRRYSSSHVAEGRIADHGVDARGQLRVAEALDADVGLGMQGAGDAAGDAESSSTPMNRMPARGMAP